MLEIWVPQIVGSLDFRFTAPHDFVGNYGIIHVAISKKTATLRPVIQSGVPGVMPSSRAKAAQPIVMTPNATILFARYFHTSEQRTTKYTVRRIVESKGDPVMMT
jgi:hypothetical protein